MSDGFADGKWMETLPRPWLANLPRLLGGAATFALVVLHLALAVICLPAVAARP